jgi:hypothetical protein
VEIQALSAKAMQELDRRLAAMDRVQNEKTNLTGGIQPARRASHHRL